MNLGKLLSARTLRKLFLWVVGCFAVYTLVGFLVLPLIIRAVLTSQLSAKLHRQVTIQEVWTNPFMFSVQVNGFSLRDRDSSAPFVSFTELFLNVQAASVFQGGPILRDIRLLAPQVTVIRNEDLTYNFSDLLETFAAQPPADAQPPPESQPPRFSLNNIQIENGSINFIDQLKHSQHEVRDLNIGIPFLSSLPYEIDVYVQPSFAARINGTPIVLSGRTKPFSDSRETALDVNLNDLALPKYLTYVPVELGFKVDSGSLDTHLALSFTRYRDRPSALTVTGKVALNKLSVTDVSGRPLLDLPLLDVALDTFDIFAMRMNLGTVLVQSPQVHLWRDQAGVLNLTSLAPQAKSENSGEPHGGSAENNKTKGAPVNIEAAEVRLTDGKVTFSDESLGKPFQTAIADLDVSIRHFSTSPQASSSIEVSLTSEAGETLHHTGEFTVEPLTVTGTAELYHLAAKRYTPYYEKYVLFDVEDAVLDFSTRYKYTQDDNGGQITLAGLATTLSTVRLKKRGEKREFLKIPTLSVKDVDVDLRKRTLVIGEVSTQKGAVAVSRESDGTVSLETLLPRTTMMGKKLVASRTAPKTSSPPWLVMLKKLVVDSYAVQVEDKVPSQPASLVIDPVSFAVENFSTEKNTKMKTALRFTLNKTGAISLGGPLSVDPLSANLKVDAKGINLIPLQPYFADKVKIVVTSGAVSANGNVTLQTTRENTVKAAFSGQLSLLKLATVTKTNAEDFLKWKSLALTGVKAGTDPVRIEINEAALTDFYSRLVVNPDATLNLQGIVTSEASAPEKARAQERQSSVAATRTAEEATRIRIAKVTLQGGNINFSDHYIKPNYSANLTQVAGKISGLSSELNNQADVDLRGRLDDTAPLDITGKINPFGRDLYVDLKVDCKDIELSPMTPYAGKYAGYNIEKGKLSMSLRYLIAARKLQAENKVFLDQFTFGDKTDSPDATTLPVRLAVSLLKDRNGAIQLDLPLTGSLDDPEFSIWGLVLKVITNIVAKAATAPFALLGAAFGGAEEELNNVEFAYGRADLDSAAEEKLRTLATALADRPALKLEVTGYVDGEKDLEGLRRYRFERKLKEQKLNDTVKKGAAEVSLDDITLEPEEYAAYLARAYKQETFAKPRNIIGLAKDLPDAEMENLMLTNIEVTEDDLQQLAKQRAQGVKEYLLQSGQIDAERIFLVKPKTSSPEKKDNIKSSRVDFAIQ